MLINPDALAAAATSEDAIANGLTFSLPGSYALAHTLISSWIARQRQNRSHLWKEVCLLLLSDSHDTVWQPQPRRSRQMDLCCMQSMHCLRYKHGKLTLI